MERNFILHPLFPPFSSQFYEHPLDRFGDQTAFIMLEAIYLLFPGLLSFWTHRKWRVYSRILSSFCNPDSRQAAGNLVQLECSLHQELKSSLHSHHMSLNPGIHVQKDARDP